MPGPLAAQAALIKDAVSKQMSATVTKVVALAVAGVFALLAVAFAAVALFFHFEQTMTPTAAALWVAGVLLAVAVVVWLFGTLIAANRRKSAALSFHAATAPLASLGLFGRGMGAGAATPPPPPPGAPPPGNPSSHAMAMEQGLAVGNRVHDTMAAHPLALVAAGLGIGTALGFFPGLRRTARRALFRSR